MNSRLTFALERAKVGDLPLAFPGKILADAKSKRLFISDSNHNRIVVTDLNGKFLETIGSGKISKGRQFSNRRILINRRDWR